MKKGFLGIILLGLGVVLLLQLPAMAAGNIFNGEKIFKSKCATCHGVNGEADGPAAKQLRPKPVNFVDDTKNTPPGRMGHKSDGELAASIRNGVKGTAMPSWYSLSDSDIQDVLAYIRSLKKK